MNPQSNSRVLCEVATCTVYFHTRLHTIIYMNQITLYLYRIRQKEIYLFLMLHAKATTTTKKDTQSPYCVTCTCNYIFAFRVIISVEYQV